MPEFVTCPACGCRMEIVERLKGQPIRCVGCDHGFQVPADDPATLQSPPVPSRDDDDDHPALPLCPGCGRRVGWEVDRCQFCGEEFDEGPAGRIDTTSWRGPRDTEPHRSGLLTGLANACLSLSGIALCCGGVPALVSIPLGITTWVMAARDLGRMRAGKMDRAGRRAAAMARTTAIVGIVLGVVILGIYGALWAVDVF